jgi:hypothetical protein
MKRAGARWRDARMQMERTEPWRRRLRRSDGHLSARGGENQNQNQKQSACQMTNGRAERQGLADSHQPWSARRSDEKQKLKIGYQKKNGQLEPEGLPTCHHEKQSAYRPKSDEKQKSRDGEKLVPRGTHRYEIQNVRCP